MKSLQKQIADSVQAISDASDTLGACVTDLREQNSVVSAEVALHLIIDISLRRQRRLKNLQRREFRALKTTIEMPFRFRPISSDCSLP